MAKSIDFFKIGQVSGGAQPDIAGAVSKGLQTGIRLLEKIEADRKKADEEIAGVLNTIGDDYDPSLFEVESVRNTLTNILQNSKTKAAGLIQEKRKLSPLDARYNELTAEINSIRGSFDRLNKNALAYNNIAKQYAQIRKEKQLTTAMDGRKVQDLDAILLNGRFNIKDDGKGNITYVAATGNEYTQEQLDDFAMPNYELATSYAGQIDGIEKYSQSTGKEIKEGDTQYTKLALGLGNLLNNYSDQELRSAGVDGFIKGMPLFLSTPEEKAAMLAATGPELKAFVQGKLMDNYLNISSEAAKLYQPPAPEFNKPTEGDKKYARNTDNIIAAAQQMYSNGTIPDSLPGMGSSTLNTKQDVIDAELEAQQAAIADGTLSKDDALTTEEISNKYPAPYYTSDLRPVQNIRQALAQLYKADENQIKSALAELNNVEGYDASKLLFSTTSVSNENESRLPKVPKEADKITTPTELTGPHATAKGFYDDLIKLRGLISTRSVPQGALILGIRHSSIIKRNKRIDEANRLLKKLKDSYPNLDLSEIEIPKKQKIDFKMDAKEIELKKNFDVFSD